MAKKKEIDITKIGPQNYKALQEANNAEYLRNDPELSAFMSQLKPIRPLMDPYENATQEVIAPDMGATPWGESMFDEKNATISGFQHLQDLRAENQPWYAQIGAGLAKGAILAGTTFLDGTIGLLTGIGTAFKEDRISGLWDNDFSKAMQAVNEWSETALPNYYTTEEQEQPWYENIFTANFLGDKFIKNLGFTVGAFYSGGLEAAGIKSLGRLAMTGAKRLGAGIKTLKDISKASSIVASGLGSVTSAVNEGRIEALNNSKDWFELHKAQLDDKFGVVNDDTSHLSNEELTIYNDTLSKISEDRLKMGNADLLMNIPILTASNIIQFGKLYANGFKTARKATNIVGRAGEYAAGTTKLGSALAITKGALSEGAEEISQGAASRIAGNYYSTDVNNFYKAKTDPGASQETLSWTKAFAEGINETVNDGSSWEEFFIGSLTGALGMPRLRGMRNAQGGFQSPITIEGGAINEWREYREKAARENEIANYMNNRINSPEFKNYYQGLIRHNKYQNDMNQAAEQGDEFNFKNAEHAQLVSDVVMFDQAGKLEDLKSAINEASGTSQEDLESIVINTTSEDENGDLIGPFSQYASKDDNGNIIANFGTEEAINDMASKINKNKEDILNTIKEYQDIKDELILKTGQRLSDEQLEELTWMKSQLSNWNTRAVEMSKDIKEAIGKILGNLNTALNYNTAIRDEEGANNTERTKTYDKANTNILNLQHNIQILDRARNKTDEELAFLLASHPEFIQDINKEIDDIDSSVMDEDSKQSIKTKLNDIKRLGNASKIYSEKLSEYLLNPTKQAEEHRKVDTQVEREFKDSEIDNMSTSDIVESIENGDLDFTGMDLNFDQSDLDILNGSNTEVSTEEVKKAERKNKIKNAVDIVNTKERVKDQARVLTKDDSQYNELVSMLEESSKSANSVDELLDFDTEIFNNPVNLETTEEEQSMAERLQSEGYNPQEIEEALLESKRERNDEIKNLLQQIKSSIDEENNELDSLPRPDDPNNVIIREFGDTDSVDSTGAGEVVNKSNTSDNNTKSANTKISEEVITPNISSPDVLSSQIEYSVSPTETRGYWKPNTTELPIHRDENDNSPYYTKIKDPQTKAFYKTIYEFLLSENVFNRINNNEVKRNQKVRFAFSKTLTNNINKALGKDIPVLLIIDENNNIIGDLSNPYDSNIFNSFDGLAELYKKAVSYAKEHSNDNTNDLIIIPNIESVVNRNYIGRPKFTSNDSSGNKTLHTLNTISEGRPFKLSLALTSSPNPSMIIEPGRRKSQGFTAEEMAIIPPFTAKAGQPFLLIETSDERRKYYPVPIIMPTLGDASTKNSTIYKKIQSIVSELGSIDNINSSDKVLRWKDKIKDFLAVDDLYVELSNTEDDIPIITLRIKRLSTDTSWDTVYKGPLDINNIMGNLEMFNIPLQISRKYINSNLDGVPYNNIIGELAKTNLEIGALHTINDFFTINPIIDNKQKKAETIADSERSLTSIRDDKKKKDSNNFVEKVIIPAQDKVDRTKTDKDFYYIKESDGKFHKYERVHRLLPSNFSGTSRYGDRALVIGSAIDNIVRDYFNTGKTTKPDYLSDEAYKAIIDYLNTLNKWVKDNGYTIYANNIVLHHKYPDGRRIAGEVDLLIVDNKGNYLIYDIKTSAYSFYTEAFDSVQQQWGQQMSTRDYYSNQLSSYATLLKDEYGKNTSKIALIPFVLSYDKANPMLVTNLIHEKNKNLDIKDVSIYFNQAISDSGISAMNEFERALAGLEDEDSDKKSINLSKDNTQNNLDVSKLSPGDWIKFQDTTFIVTRYDSTNKVLYAKDLGGDEVRFKEDTFKFITLERRVADSLPRDEALQRIKSTKLFRTPQRKALLNKLEDDVLSDIANMKEPILSARLSKLDALVKPNMSKEDINTLVKQTLTTTLNRDKTNDEASNEYNLEKEIERVRKALPQLSRDESIVLVNSVIKTPSGYAWGQFKDGIITLYKNAAKGTAYHEAFHYVFNTLMSNSEIEESYNAARQQWGNLDAIELEERMAEDFREYMQNEETFLGRLKNTWRRLKNFINKLKGKESYLDNLYYNISEGKYNNTDTTSRRITRNSSIISNEERNSILRNAKRDSKGRLLAPNGIPSNLTEEQYIQVRTKSFKNWFGDWENNPKEASKVVDKNGEPLVVYHGSAADFTEFSYKYFGTTDPGDNGRGFYFAYNREVAEGYGDVVKSYFLNIRNPFIHTGKETQSIIKGFNRIYNPTNKDILEKKIKDITSRIKRDKEALSEYDDDFHREILSKRIKNNEDSLNKYLKELNTKPSDYLNKRIWDTLDGYDGVMEKEPHYQIVVRNSNQIKSATDNIGTFDSSNPDIRYRELTKEDIQRIVDSNVNNPMVNRTRVSKNNSWGKLVDSLSEQGYTVKGYYNRVRGGYIVTSTSLNQSIKQANDIRSYHINKLEYNNLTEEQKEYLTERNLSLSAFNNMTLEEKEILFECMS